MAERKPSIIYINGKKEYVISDATLGMLRVHLNKSSASLCDHEKPEIIYINPAYILEDGKSYDLIDPSEKKRSCEDIKEDSDWKKEVNRRLDKLAKRQKNIWFYKLL
jgi:hypothetical protein